MKKKNKLVLVILILIFVAIIGTSIGITIVMSPVSKDDTNKNIVIENGMLIDDIADLLKKENLIRNKKAFIYYARFKKMDNIYAASYEFNESMSMNEIFKTLSEGGQNKDEIKITFNEGINMRRIATIIEKNTNNSYEDVMNKLKDTKYLDKIIDEYWFLTDDIKNPKIYYSLEGYLYPETYFFNSKDIEVEDIFKKMLDQTDKILSKYKKEIKKSKYSVHELLTLASITQSEGITADDFKNIASVFYNRLEKSMSLGSDVTSCYGVKKDLGSSLTTSDFNDNNPYNTRRPDVIMPVGPISNSSKEALDAVLNPIETDYLFFVSDKNKKFYFNKTNNEHDRTVSKLINEGLWAE